MNKSAITVFAHILAVRHLLLQSGNYIVAACDFYRHDRYWTIHLMQCLMSAGTQSGVKKMYEMESRNDS